MGYYRSLADANSCLVNELRLNAREGWIHLEHFLANINAVNKSFGLEIIESEAEAYSLILAATHSEGLLIM